MTEPLTVTVTDTKKVTVGNVRSVYPHPVSAQVGKASYCVAGAFLQYVYGGSLGKNGLPYDARFPSPALLTQRALEWVLGETCSEYVVEKRYPLLYRIAREVVVRNDAANFNGAWNALGDLIEHLRILQNYPKEET